MQYRRRPIYSDQRGPALAFSCQANAGGTESRNHRRAIEFLLKQPDAHIHRRRCLDLITHTAHADGTATRDCRAAEIFLLSTADRLRPRKGMLAQGFEMK